MKKIVFVTPPDAQYGFSLTGVRQLVASEDELQGTLIDLVGDPAIGVLVIDERLIGAPAQERLRETERRWPGLVIVLPAPEKIARPEDDYALQLIRRAVGYHVRVSV